MDEYRGKPGAVNVGPFVGVDLNRADTAVKWIKRSLTALKPTETNSFVAGLDWHGIYYFLDSVADCDSHRGLHYAIIAQGRLWELCLKIGL